MENNTFSQSFRDQSSIEKYGYIGNSLINNTTLGGIIDDEDYSFFTRKGGEGTKQRPGQCLQNQSFQSIKKIPFNSASSRFKESKSMLPPVGLYDPKDISTIFKKNYESKKLNNESKMITNSLRFNEGFHKNHNPAPGQYQISQQFDKYQKSTLQKQNVSYQSQTSYFFKSHSFSNRYTNKVKGPAPGDYDPEIPSSSKYKGGEATSVFRSKLLRFLPNQDNGGYFEYSLTKDKKRPSQNISEFQSTELEQAIKQRQQKRQAEIEENMRKNKAKESSFFAKPLKKKVFVEPIIADVNKSYRMVNNQLVKIVEDVNEGDFNNPIYDGGFNIIKPYLRGKKFYGGNSFSQYKQEHLSASFAASRADRSQCMHLLETTPGPAAYNTEAELDTKKQKKVLASGSSFKSEIPRQFYQINDKQVNIGPGSYQQNKPAYKKHFHFNMKNQWI